MQLTTLLITSCGSQLHKEHTHKVDIFSVTGLLQKGLFYTKALITFEALNPSISSQIRSKSPLVGSTTWPLLVTNGNVGLS